MNIRDRCVQLSQPNSAVQNNRLEMITYSLSVENAKQQQRLQALAKDHFNLQEHQQHNLRAADVEPHLQKLSDDFQVLSAAVWGPGGPMEELILARQKITELTARVEALETKLAALVKTNE